MIWSIDQDDYSGLFCGQGQFPLLRRIHDTLFPSHHNTKQESFTTAEATKLVTKPITTSVTTQQSTTKRQKITITSIVPLPRAKFFNRGVKHTNPIYLLSVIGVYFFI